MLALDIGIKHLAYCVSNDTGIIQQWSIVNLTEDTNVPVVCMVCTKPAKVVIPDGTVCGKHVPKSIPWITDKKTSPTIPELQAFLKEREMDIKGKKEILLARAKTVGAMYLPKIKSVMTWAENTCRLHDAIRSWITRDWEHMKQVQDVYIEHQPVLKNPVMKTVQLLIFASMRERYLTTPRDTVTRFHFVHAGKKVQGMEAGDAGYKDRKKGGEQRVQTHLETFPIDSSSRGWLDWWKAQPKRDDLADALCMILDHVKK